MAFRGSVHSSQIRVCWKHVNAAVPCLQDLGLSSLLFCHSCQGQRDWAWLWGRSHSSPEGCLTTQKGETTGARSLSDTGRLIMCLQSVFESKVLWKERHSAHPAIREASKPSGGEPLPRSSLNWGRCLRDKIRSLGACYKHPWKGGWEEEASRRRRRATLQMKS